MPATLHFSNSLDALAERLIAALAKERDPLAATAIATPGPAVRDWLKIRVAEETGVAAGLAFPHLENMLWDRLAERDRHRDAPDRLPARQLDAFGFQGLVLAELRRDPPAAVRDYLAGALPEDTARRQCQLAGLLAALFREYEYNRVAENGYEGVPKSWMRGEPCFERHLLRGGAGHPARAHLEEVRALESWQMTVYASLFRKDEGLRDRWGAATGIYRYTLAQYAALALESPMIPVSAEKPPVFHLFGLSNVSPFHRDLIGQLADANTLGNAAAHFEIYALNPCAEFWEDALSLNERRARGRRRLVSDAVPPARIESTRPDASEIAEGELREFADENGLLELLGKPGRETVKLWCQLTDHDFIEDFREPEKSTLLDAVRASLLHRAGPLAERVAQDDSLRIRSAPDPRAEIEAARAEAAALLKENPNLRPEDLAILVADPDEALPMLRAAFSGGSDVPGNAPALLPSGGALEESPLLRAFRALMELGAGPADRGALLDFLDAPAARRMTGNTEAAPARGDALAAFLTTAGFQEGWEGEGPSTLRAAVERALWALAMDAEDPALKAVGEAGRAGAGIPASLEREEVASLLDGLEALREATRPLRDGASRTFAEWARLLRNLAARFLAAGSEEGRSEMELRWFLDDLEAWGRWDESDGERVDATLIRMLFADRFRSVDGAGRGALLRGGIRIGGLAHLRGLPFRHVWVTGLSADFPASSESAPLDLRGYRRLPGETSPAARDLYALLEVIAATTGRLSLSWPARDASGNEQEPSRALTGLAAWLESDVLPGHGHESTPFAFGAMRSPAELPPRRAPRHDIEWAEEPRRQPVIDWRDLDAFLENPAAHAALRRFRAGAWDALDVEEEGRAATLFLDGREDAALLEPALRAELLEPGAGALVFERLWAERARGGLVPPEPYGDIEAARLRAEVAAADHARTLRAFMDEAKLRFAGSLRLGPQGPARAEPPVLNLPAFEAAGVKVGGIFPWFFQSGESREERGGWALMVEKGREFPAYLFQLCAEAADETARDTLSGFAGSARVFVRDAKEGTLEAFPLERIPRAKARELLDALIEDFSHAAAGEGHLDDLPLSLVEALLKDEDDDADAVANWAEALREKRYAQEESSFARTRMRDKLLRAIGPEIPENARPAVRRRVLPYLEWKQQLRTRKKNAARDEDA